MLCGADVDRSRGVSGRRSDAGQRNHAQPLRRACERRRDLCSNVRHARSQRTLRMFSPYHELLRSGLHRPIDGKIFCARLDQAQVQIADWLSQAHVRMGVHPSD